MGITHLAVNLCLRNQCGNRVHNHDIDRTGAHHRLGNLKSLLAVVRLGDIQIIDINTDLLRICRIECMLCIDKSSDTASLLYFCHHMQGNRRLTTGLRSVYLDDSSLRNTAQSQCNIQAQGAGRNRLYIHIRTRITQLHH